MTILMNILYILLFILCLSVLIIVHELGHLSMAKAFKVYCFEFSIGFGPKLFSIKRKKGETRFSLRAIPFGGYVSMYGESGSLPEGVVVDESRSLNHIKKWKRGIVLAAGVTMNALLALTVFFISNTCFQQIQVSASHSVIVESSIASESGLTDEDIIYLETKTFSNAFIVDDACTINMNTDPASSITGVAVLSSSLKSYNDLSWSDYLYFYNVEGLSDIENIDKNLIDYSQIASVKFTITRGMYDENNELVEATGEDAKTFAINANVLQKDITVFELEDLGISFYANRYWNSFGTSVKNTFVDFGTSSIAIFKGLGSLFTSPDQVGGIIAVGYQTTSVLQNFGLNSFLRIWALISVNLAIINLLPFPGLDGWHLLVLIVEGISHKEIPAKVKGIMSFVGMILLFGLMILLLFKDVFTYIL